MNDHAAVIEDLGGATYQAELRIVGWICGYWLIAPIVSVNNA
jgi:hypothetical protein